MPRGYPNKRAKRANKAESRIADVNEDHGKVLDEAINTANEVMEHKPYKTFLVERCIDPPFVGYGELSVVAHWSQIQVLSDVTIQYPNMYVKVTEITLGRVVTSAKR